MNVLFVTNKPSYPSIDGGSIATRKIIEGLVYKKVKLNVLSLSSYKHAFDKSAIPQDISSKVHFTSQHVDLRIRLFNLLYSFLFKQVPYIVSRFYSRIIAQRIEEMLKEQEYDVIILESVFLGPYLAGIRKLSDAKVVLRAPNIEHSIWMGVAEHSSYLKRFYLKQIAHKLKQYESNIFQLVDGIATVTDDDSQAIKTVSSTPIANIPVGVNIKACEQHYKHQHSIYFIGALDWKPNLDGLKWFVENVWDELTKLLPHLEFHVAGKRTPAEIHRIKRKNIFIHGQVRDAQQFMREHGVMVVPLFSGSGMRVKIVEAMSQLSPVVSSSIGASGIPVTHERDILIANKKQEFVEQIKRLIAHEEEAQRIAYGGVQILKNHFDDAVIAEKFYGFLKQLTASNFS